MVEDLLREILLELRGLRRDLARRRDPVPGLLAAIADELGDARWTVAGILSIADEDRNGPLARALVEVLDLDAPAHSRSTALGSLLAKLPGVEVVAQQRGVRVYRLEAHEGRDLAA